jgi:acyl transferase domain-containing protein/NADPH:quinone reductase-like Zn-dependent oxidoreductase/short-subunit dehydrogenase/acyl carrier protein
MDIAIVGAACRLPGGIGSPDALWRKLRAGENLISEIPASRWNKDLFKHENVGEPGRSYTFRAGVLDDAAAFDAGFFGISPREAEQMDPQQRVLLETAWEAVERAGWTASGLARSDCAVYVGVSGTDYANIRLGDPAGGNAHFMTGNTLSVVANRLSYAFDLAGPSMAVDTACSSAVAALYEACAGLSEGRFESALVGAVNLLLSPYPFIGFARASMLSEYGQSKAFADGATGYVRGEGAGVLALKPLAKALADGDPVRAVIRSVDLNQDGRTNGIALPSGTAQAALLQRIYPGADVDPADLDYFEAHGTGTAVGDPTEAGAIGHSLGQHRQSSDPLTIGSVKTNIGHLEPAAGLASVLKAVLSLENGEIPPSLHSATLNPIIPFDELNLSVAQKLQPLKRRAGAGLVGVNSFGFGGLNGHVIVEGPPRRAARRRSLAPANDGAPEPAPWPLPISARSNESLFASAANLADALEHDPTLALRDVALTLWRRRSHLERRAVLKGDDRERLIQNLRTFGAGDADGAGAVTGTVLAPDVKVGFVFSGNGAQWAGMGQKLLAEDPAFAAGARRASDAVAAVSGMSPLDMMAGPVDAIDIDRTEIAQPLLFVLQAGLVAAFEARGILPDATVGHSVGEIGAAYAAGALDLEQAARVIVRRSEAQAMTRGLGRMAAVNQDAVAIGARLQRLGGKVELAAINSPNAVTLSGDEAALQALVTHLKAEGVEAMMLDLDYAFHSHAMEAARAPLAASLTGLAPRPARLPFFSTADGGKADGETLDADYWWRNIRAPVRFHDAITALLEHDPAPGRAWTLLEIGPHPILQGYLRQTARPLSVPARPLGAMTRKADGADRLTAIANEAFCLGAPLNYDAVSPARGDVVDLPTYPWAHEHYWFKRTEEAEGLQFASREGALLGFRARSDQTIWDAQIDTTIFPDLADHKVGDAAIFPAAGYAAMLLEAAAAMQADAPDAPVALEEFEIRRPLVLDDERSTMVRVVVEGDGRADLLAKPRLADAPWALHARARIVKGASLPAPLPNSEGMEPEEIQPETLYGFAESIGLQYGPAYQPVEAMTVGGDWALAALAEPRDAARGGPRVIAPEQLDGAMQALIALLMQSGMDAGGDAMLPVAINRVVARPNALAAAAGARLLRAGPRAAVADLALYDESGDAVLSAEGARFQRASLNGQRSLSEQVYVWRDHPLTGALARGAAHVPARSAVAKAARLSAPVVPEIAAAAKRLGAVKSRKAWRIFWEAHPGWAAEASLRAGLLSETAPDAARIEHLLSGGPLFARLRQAVTGAVDAVVAAASDSQRLRILEIGGPAGPLAARYADRIGADIDWVYVDAAPDRRARAAAFGAEVFEDVTDNHAISFDLAIAPFVLSPEALLGAEGALAPGGIILAGAPKQKHWLNAVWREGLGSEASDDSAWREAFVGAAKVDCGAGSLWLGNANAAAESGADADASPSEPRTWLIMAGAAEKAAANAAVKALGARGDTATVQQIGGEDGLNALATALDGADVVVSIAGARSGADDVLSEQIVQRALPALAAARKAMAEAPPRLIAVSADEGPVSSAMEGLMSVLANEAPDLRPLSLVAAKGKGGWPAWGAALADALPAALARQNAEDEDRLTIAPDGGVRAIRLARLPLVDPKPGSLGFKQGALDSVAWRSAAPEPQALNSGEITVDVRAAGVNFRDIMFGLGLLPEEAVEAGFAGATVGMEAAGVVSAVGPDVTRLKAGDRVVCVAPACFSNQVTTLASAAARIPAGQDFAAAATLPIVTLTAYYSLASLARLGPDDTVLIHGAAGGVGLAAIQYAQHAGARIIATAGSDEKRNLLEMLGVELITDSRSLAFVDDVRRWTDGAGVDVALNSLAGEAMEATLALMRPFGRFIELGKRDFFENTQVGLRRMRENVSYFAVDADQLLAAKPLEAARLFGEVEGLIAKGVFRPLPYRAFPAEALPDALKWMQRARHIGKVIVEAPKAAVSTVSALPVRKDAAYLVIGGLEGFGLETARWLADRGAGRIVLASRRGGDAPDADAAIADLTARGAKASVARLDVTDARAVDRLVRRLDGKRRPLKGVIHAAALYADGLAAEMSIEQFASAIRVKADGAAALDAATRGLAADGRALDFFILYSSATTLLGNPGQANYVAANAALEAIAEARAKDGLPALTVAWGPIADTGALKRNAAVSEHLERHLGRPPMPPRRALDLLDGLWASGAPAPTVLDVDWRALSPRSLAPARFEAVAPTRENDGGVDFLELIADLEEADARDVVAEVIAEKVAEVLGMTADSIDLAKPVADLGLDSLMGMELKLGLEERIGVELPPMLLAEGASVNRIAEKVTAQLRSGGMKATTRERNVVDATLRQHAGALDPEALDEAITTFRKDDSRKRLLS